MKKVIYSIFISLVSLISLVSARYPELNGTKVGADLTETLCYADAVTNGWFSFTIIWAFFAVVLIASLFAQFRYTGRIRFETSLLASSFASIGWAVIITQKDCLSSPVSFYFLIGIFILSVIWSAMSYE